MERYSLSGIKTTLRLYKDGSVVLVADTQRNKNREPINILRDKWKCKERMDYLVNGPGIGVYLYILGNNFSNSRT